MLYHLDIRGKNQTWFLLHTVNKNELHVDYKSNFVKDKIRKILNNNIGEYLQTRDKLGLLH